MTAPAEDSQAQPRPVLLQLLGVPRLRTTGGDWVPLGRHDALLLALLTVEHEADRRRTAALLWPDSDAARANNSLRQRIFRLKRQAGADLVHGEAVIRLAAGVHHDLVLGPPDAEPPVGELLGGWAIDGDSGIEEWLLHARGRWRRQRRERLAAMAGQLENEGRLAAALALAHRLLDDDPAAEHAHRRLMRLHYLRGDRAAAMAAFDRCREQLAALLATKPGMETLALAELIGRSALPSQPVTAPPPAVLRRPPRTVGRDDARRQIEQALAAGRCVLLCGEPGVGKTRLAQDVAQARGGADFAGAVAGDQAVPYATASRWLLSLVKRCGAPETVPQRSEMARLVPGLATPPPGPLQPHKLVDAAWSVVQHAAQSGALLLVFDDLQFADPASLELLLTLAGRSRGSGVSWLLAVRHAERPPALDTWLAGSDGQLTEEVRLGELDVAAVTQLLQDLAMPGIDVEAWGNALHRHAGGHPMRLLETLRSAADRRGALPPRPPASLPVPQPIGRMIDKRLESLPRSARRLAQLAALAGPDFSVALAAQVLRVHEIDLAGPWSELEAAQFMASRGFVHDLVREACLASVPAPIARALHRQIAAASAAAGAPSARVAEHWRLAEHWSEAASAYREAAAVALAAGRRREEATLLATAAECHGRAGQPGPRFEALCDRIGALVQCADAGELRTAIAELADPPAGAAPLRDVAAAEAQIVFGDFDAVVQSMPAAIAAAAASGQAELSVLAARRHAVALVNLGRHREAAAALAERLPAAEALEPIRPRYEFLGEYATVLERCNRRREGFDVMQRAIALATAAGDDGTAATMHVNLGVNRVYWGDAGAAVAATERGLALRTAHDGLAGLAAGMDMTLGAMCRDAGRSGEAVQRLERSLAAFEADGNRLWIGNAQSHLALLWLQLGQPARAAHLLGGNDDGLPPFIVARRIAARALLARERGREALPLLDDALAALRGADRADVRLAIELERCRELPAGDTAKLADQVAREAEAAELMGHAFAARVLAASARQAQGRAPRLPARELRAIAAASPTLAPSGFDRVVLWRHLAGVLERSGDAMGAQRVRQHLSAWIGAGAGTLPEPLRAAFQRRAAAPL